MTETFYRIRSDIVDHTTYGGELTAYDFDEKHTIKTMADKIMRDFAFDRGCKKNIELREKAKKYKKGKGENQNGNSKEKE